ncbi:TIGR04168 family protein [Waterburya agarophytonicola K14]|uniref:TIGR04168 family protein n=1 Tax=Waterburya agarophytonicola KI4 TaxID=2874699 RepID=A0A964FF78_9CYAN|nr:TIGR04168 family protein [Waterburya agarophytonicola]MCC0177475.1 TIGR04168 family protein [Waterburya agarophytonicola KI4]
MSPKKSQITIAVVGDVHNQWDERDELTLQHLGIDLVLFVGDFGNEAVEVVRKIAAVKTPKAAIAGNHDAWYSASSWGRQKAPYDQSTEDRVQQQLDLLGDAHVGFSQLDFADYELSVVGSRPFSWGGSTWRNSQFYRDRYNVKSFAQSAEQIVTMAQNCSFEDIIIIGHNGPHGLGSKTESICGRDWKPDGGDYGDPDLTQAIADIRNIGKSIPLVTFGHMHHALKHPSGKRRTIVEFKDDTVYLNAACVPRVIKGDGNIKRNFSLVSFEGGVVREISLVWVNSDFTIESEEILYCEQ